MAVSVGAQPSTSESVVNDNAPAGPPLRTSTRKPKPKSKSPVDFVHITFLDKDSVSPFRWSLGGGRHLVDIFFDCRIPKQDLSARLVWRAGNVVVQENLPDVG